MDYKKAFYSKLQDCYLGVKLKDFQQGNVAKNGFSNLLKIKERYFQHIKAYLDSQIGDEIESHDTLIIFKQNSNELSKEFLKGLRIEDSK